MTSALLSLLLMGVFLQPGLAQAPTGAITVTMVTDQAGLGDQGFNDLAWAGLQKAAAELGVEAKFIESREFAQYVPNLSAAARTSELTVGVGFLLTDAIAEVAKQNPDRKFALIDAVAEEGVDNIASVVFREQEASFLAGVAAGLMSKSGKVGAIGGIEIPPVVRWISGFQAGVKTANPEAEVLVGYVGSFADPAQGKGLAEAQIAQGADILFEVGGLSGTGVFEAVRERGAGLWVIASDKDKSQLAPDHQLAAVAKAVDVAVFSQVEAVAKGTFQGGILDLGLKEGGMALLTPGNKIPAAVMQQVQTYEAQIEAGTLVPPTTAEELAAFQLP
ncbi:MAG: BMP family ABC transporter substrate-binding protein [Thermostichus sp. DRC_bins_24]